MKILFLTLTFFSINSATFSTGFPIDAIIELVRASSERAYVISMFMQKRKDNDI